MIYGIGYTPKAIRMYKKLTPDIQSEVREAIDLLADSNNHNRMKVHALSGDLSGVQSARVNYSHRILFQIEKKKITIIIIGIGSHDIYK